MHWNKNEPGINTELLLLLQEKLAHITIRGLRQFIMMYDGMTIKDGVYYDRFSGALQGLEDIGDLISFTRVQFGGQPQVRIAKECMQFMNSGRIREFKANRSTHSTSCMYARAA